MTKPAPTVKRRILVIDDEATLTRTVKLALEQTGRYEVFTLNHASAAVQVAREVRPDLVLLDVMMPEMDGGEVAAGLRAEPATSHVPIVFLTAAVDPPEVESRGGLIGGFPFVAKPVSKSALIEVIERNLPG